MENFTEFNPDSSQILYYNSIYSSVYFRAIMKGEKMRNPFTISLKTIELTTVRGISRLAGGELKVKTNLNRIGTEVIKKSNYLRPYLTSLFN